MNNYEAIELIPVPKLLLGIRSQLIWMMVMGYGLSAFRQEGTWRWEVSFVTPERYRQNMLYARRIKRQEQSS